MNTSYFKFRVSPSVKIDMDIFYNAIADSIKERSNSTYNVLEYSEFWGMVIESYVIRPENSGCLKDNI
jgi:hypothetical protein